MIPPPPSTNKPVAFYDTECFPNYWLLKFRVRGGPVFSFSLRMGENFETATMIQIERLFALFTVISFNGIYYDAPMISRTLDGFTTEQLKWTSDQLIIVQIKPWDLGLSDWKPRDHIDLLEVAPGAGSQKQYAGRIHSKVMRDLPFEPDRYLTENEIAQVDEYCENDLTVLEDLYNALAPQLSIRQALTERYGIDLRSKSDAQLGESIIKLRCEQELGQRIYKPEIDWNIKFRYDAPEFLSFQSEPLKAAFRLIKESIFQLGPSGNVAMPEALEGLEIPLGQCIYKLGIGGLHSKEKKIAHHSNESVALIDADVASYYPNLILNSGKYPPALGPTMLKVYRSLKDERLEAKGREKKLPKDTPEWNMAHSENEGGKVAINGPFGKLGSHYSILFAPEMLIQTTVTGQLSLLMLIEWHEMQEIPVVSANTDGILIRCSREKIPVSESIIRYWEKRTGLEMETSQYRAVYSRDVNNYFAVKLNGEVKRKGEFSKAGLIEKKNPDVEICSDAVAEFLSKGIPILYTIASCRDIRKFVTVRKVTGGGVKLWGEGPNDDLLVKEFVHILKANGWEKKGHKWFKGGMGDFEEGYSARSAYKLCFLPQRPEYLGKVVRWYYSTKAPGTIVCNTNGNTVSLSYGARPAMTLPDEFPDDIDYDWYFKNCESILKDVAYYGQ